MIVGPPHPLRFPNVAGRTPQSRYADRHIRSVGTQAHHAAGHIRLWVSWPGPTVKEHRHGDHTRPPATGGLVGIRQRFTRSPLVGA